MIPSFDQLADLGVGVVGHVLRAHLHDPLVLLAPPRRVAGPGPSATSASAASRSTRPCRRARRRWPAGRDGGRAWRCTPRPPADRPAVPCSCGRSCRRSAAPRPATRGPYTSQTATGSQRPWAFSSSTMPMCAWQRPPVPMKPTPIRSLAPLAPSSAMVNVGRNTRAAAAVTAVACRKSRRDALRIV